jgi:hypothetical protein
MGVVMTCLKVNLNICTGTKENHESLDYVADLQADLKAHRDRSSMSASTLVLEICIILRYSKLPHRQSPPETYIASESWVRLVNSLPPL